MSVRIKSFDVAAAIAKGEEAATGIRTMVTMAAREDTKPYVPYVTGDLRGTAETESVPEEGLLVWGNASVPYAAAQYYLHPNKTWPGTVMQWFEESKAANMPAWERTAQEAAREVFS